MNSLQTVIFDLDGTLVHSVPDMQVSLNRVLEGMGRASLSEETVQSFVGNGVTQLIIRALDATGGVTKADKKQAVGAFLDDYATQKTVLTRSYPGVDACLERLAARGVSMGVCTNKPQDAAVELCDVLNLSRFFGDITGAREGLARKPDAGPLQACMSALNAEAASTIYVGDSAVDYDTAQNAQVPFRLYSGGYLNRPLPELGPEARFDDWDTVTFHL